MLTIGKASATGRDDTAGSRHYHAVGVLPQPVRQNNGYRQYDLTDAVRLIRVRRLVELGLTLSEIADAQRAGNGDDGDLREV